MAVPEPPVSLDNSCSVIYDNVLYSFAQDAFLSLSLEPGAKWKKLEAGVKVSGATCVGSTPSDASQAGLFVVGGTSPSADYPGLQKYTYASGNWTTITPKNLVTKDRQWHGSTYIQANDAIMVYAGNQDGVRAPESTTFSIGASAPYAVQSIPSSAPPAISPILLSWTVADAIYVGGDATNTGVYLLNPDAGWRNFGATLAEPLVKSTSVEQAIMMTGDDGSKSLLTFDMSTSPNQVNRLVLQDASGQPVLNSAAVTSRNLGVADKHKRSLTLKNWPEYNSTFAPKATRTNFALAQGENGMVVISGGNSEQPLVMFNAEKNSWVNGNTFFSKGEESILNVPSSSSTRTSHTSTRFHHSTSSVASSTTHTSAAIHTTSAAAVAPVATGKHDDHSFFDTNTILGITLGSILGLLAILGLLLFLVRRSKRQREHAETGHQRRASGLDSGEKESSGFAKNTLAPPSPGHFRGHHPQTSQESYSSMAILMGRMNQNKQGLTRQPSNDSSRSSVSSLHKHFKSTIGRPMPQATDRQATRTENDKGVAFASDVAEPRPRNHNSPVEGQDGLRRSSGWNRYWSGGSALQLLGFGGATKRTTVGSEQSSHYSQGTASRNPRVTQDSATVPPLNFEGRPEVNRVNTGSPIVSKYSHHQLRQGMAGKIERPASNASSGYSSGIPESINDSWDPSDGSRPWGTERAPSDAYNNSFYYATPLAPGRSSNRQSPSSTASGAPSGTSKQPHLAMAAPSSDMSWLNLGDQSRPV